MKREELEKAGFEKRGVYDEPRLSEILEMYKEANFEVVVLDYEEADDAVCSACLDNEQKGRYKVVYTKKKT
ncbi:MAG: hypothetical protein OHK0040_11050 [bacterium]